MESIQDSNDNLEDEVNRNEKVIPTDKLSYLCPNGHRMTHQMRWFKGSSDRGLRSNIAQ